MKIRSLLFVSSPILSKNSLEFIDFKQALILFMDFSGTFQDIAMADE